MLKINEVEILMMTDRILPVVFGIIWRKWNILYQISWDFLGEKEVCVVKIQYISRMP